MLKKTITYTDFNGVERTEDFFFNLTKAELTEMELSTDGGLGTKIQSIIDAKDNKEIMRLFKTIILKAYGEKSDDGRRLLKSTAISEAFATSEPYSVIFMEITSDANVAASFINAVIPKLDTPNAIPAPKA